MCAPSHVSHRTRARHSQLKALCCVDAASDHARRRDSGGTVSSEEHDSPLVARRDFASSSGREAVPPRFRAPTPPPFECADSAAEARGDAEGPGDGGETSGGSRDDLRRDSEGGGGAASEGEFEKPFDGEPPPPREALWREKRGLLRKTPGAEKRASPSFTRTGHERLEPRNGPRARRRSFDGERETVARGEGKKKTHHRADSEPVPGYVPPRLEREPAPNEASMCLASEAGDLVSRLKNSRGKSAAWLPDAKRDPTGGATDAFKERLKKSASLLGAHARSASGVSVTSTLCDEDACPTCFEGYDAENPKMPLVCGHHFHLACVYEWYERSDKCPVCEVKMEFDPSTGWSLEG